LGTHPEGPSFWSARGGIFAGVRGPAARGGPPGPAHRFPAFQVCGPPVKDRKPFSRPNPESLTGANRRPISVEPSKIIPAKLRGRWGANGGTGKTQKLPRGKGEICCRTMGTWSREIGTPRTGNAVLFNHPLPRPLPLPILVSKLVRDFGSRDFNGGRPQGGGTEGGGGGGGGGKQHLGALFDTST